MKKNTKSQIAFFKISCILLSILLLTTNVYSQTKEYLILEIITKKPLSYVNVFYPHSMEGSISNEDGNVEIFVQNDTVVFSHIGYKSAKLIPSKDLIFIDTIYLKPTARILREVTIYDVDIKNKMRYILKNYNKLYNVGSTLYECTYKEKMAINDTLVRLFQAQLKWWNKKYRYRPTKAIGKNNDVSLNAIDYSKILDQTELANTGYIENKDLLKFLHINYYPEMIIDHGKEIKTILIEKNEEFTTVFFSTPIEENGIVIMDLKEGVIYFDNNTGAIIQLSFKFVYNYHVEYWFSHLKEMWYSTKIKQHDVSISFVKNPENRLVLSSFKSNILGEFNYGSITEELNMQQDLFVTKVEKDKMISMENLIDLNKPIFTNFPLDKKSNTKILLTKEEIDFIKN